MRIDHLEDETIDKGIYLELEEAEKWGRRNPAFFRKLDNEDYEQEEQSYPYTKKQVLGCCIC